MLAPLGLSEFSECSLEHVRAVATGCQVPEVVLLTVVEPVRQVAELSEDLRRNLEKQEKAAAEDYLSELADSLKKEDIAVQSAIVSGRPDEEILDYATKNQVDLTYYEHPWKIRGFALGLQQRS